MLDPQVQIRIIDLAWLWAKETMQPRRGPRTTESRILARAEAFDLAYKYIFNTIQGSEVGSVSTEED